MSNLTPTNTVIEGDQPTCAAYREAYVEDRAADMEAIKEHFEECIDCQEWKQPGTVSVQTVFFYYKIQKQETPKRKK